ncbi:MAG: hydrogenase nickel incorporation protein HypA/HybF [Acidobacteriota bacterium]|jgi:hydrogenase nickel incorporation protein HypA/HybF|nr:hydrogenase nickel incorporation protein HypA/HybF [Acidobacteriota bacterium]
MHEYSIIQSLVDSVAAAVGSRDAAVQRVDVAIGEMAGVDCVLLATAFEVFREGTLCEHAVLTIDRIAARWECPRCAGEVVRGGFLRCAICNAPARLATGDEIILQRIELEVA